MIAESSSVPKESLSSRTEMVAALKKLDMAQNALIVTQNVQKAVPIGGLFAACNRKQNEEKRKLSNERLQVVKQKTCKKRRKSPDQFAVESMLKHYRIRNWEENLNPICQAKLALIYPEPDNCSIYRPTESVSIMQAISC